MIDSSVVGTPKDETLRQLVQLSARPQPRSAFSDRFELIVEIKFVDERHGLGSTSQKTVGAQIDGTTGERGGGERSAHALAGFDHFDTRGRLRRARSAAREFPRRGESADSSADDDDRRTAH